MVSPFDNKQVLLARVGIKDDTCRRKFKDTKLTEFFGIKGGGKSSTAMTDRLEQKETVLEASPESLLKLPHRPRDLSATPVKASKQRTSPVKEHSIDVCSAEQDDSIVKPYENGFYFLISGLFVALLLVTKFEKQFL